MNTPDAMPVLAPSLGLAPPGQPAFSTYGFDDGPDDMLMDGSGRPMAAKSEIKAEAAEEEAMNPLDMDSDEDDEEFGDVSAFTTLLLTSSSISQRTPT